MLPKVGKHNLPPMSPLHFDSKINFLDFQKRVCPADITIKNIPIGLKYMMC